MQDGPIIDQYLNIRHIFDVDIYDTSTGRKIDSVPVEVRSAGLGVNDPNNESIIQEDACRNQDEYTEQAEEIAIDFIFNQENNHPFNRHDLAADAQFVRTRDFYTDEWPLI